MLLLVHLNGQIWFDSSCVSELLAVPVGIGGYRPADAVTMLAVNAMATSNAMAVTQTATDPDMLRCSFWASQVGSGTGLFHELAPFTLALAMNNKPFFDVVAQMFQTTPNAPFLRDEIRDFYIHPDAYKGLITRQDKEAESSKAVVAAMCLVYPWIKNQLTNDEVEMYPRPA